MPGSVLESRGGSILASAEALILQQDLGVGGVLPESQQEVSWRVKSVIFYPHDSHEDPFFPSLQIL